MLDVPYTAATNIQLRLSTLSPPVGPGKPGMGSGLDRVAIKVTRLDGTVLGEWRTTQPDIATTPPYLFLFAPPNSKVLVFVTRPTGSTPTVNDFYQVAVNFYGRGAVEADSVLNDAPATAQVLPFNANSVARITGTIGTGDVDHYALDLTANDTLTMKCSAYRIGSGLHAVWELLSPTLDVVQAETESEHTNTWWNSNGGSAMSVLVPTTGRYVFKVSGASQEGGNPSNHYTCDFFLTRAP